MADKITKSKLGFPGMLDRQYRNHRDKLMQAEAVAKKAAKARIFKAAADKLFPRWDNPGS